MAKFITALLTVLTGLLGLFNPAAVGGFINLPLQAENTRARTEIRVIFGALFVALGGLALARRDARAYRDLGLVYLALGAVRAGATLYERAFQFSNLFSAATEFGAAFALLRPAPPPPPAPDHMPDA